MNRDDERARLKGISVGQLIDDMESCRTSIVTFQARLDLIMEELRTRKYKLPALPRKKRAPRKASEPVPQSNSIRPGGGESADG